MPRSRHWIAGAKIVGNDPDIELAIDGARVAWKSLVKFFAAGALAITFAVRGLMCEAYPSEGPVFEYWGNHCGPGHGTGGEALDDLDEACRKHDRAY